MWLRKKSATNVVQLFSLSVVSILDQHLYNLETCPGSIKHMWQLFNGLVQLMYSIQKDMMMESYPIRIATLSCPKSTHT